MRRAKILMRGFLLFKDWHLWLAQRLHVSTRRGVGTFRFRNGVSFKMDFAHSSVGTFQEVWLMDLYQKHHRIKKGDVVVDIGANIGAFSVLAASRGARVFAYEPTPRSFRYLVENTRNYDVTRYNLAVADHGGTTTIFESSGSDEGNGPNPDTASSSSFTAKATTLSAIIKDNAITRCDLLKMDCEGCESAVLRGDGAKEAFQKVANIAMEYHKNLPEVRRVLEAYGYKIIETTGGEYGYLYASRPQQPPRP